MSARGWARAADLLRVPCVGVLVAVALGCPPARAQVQAVPLTWNAPTGCPPAEAVVASVKQNLVDSGKAAAPFVAAVVVRQAAGGRWQAQLRVETRGGRTERTFEAESCEAISAAAALIVALSAESVAGAPVGSDPHVLGQLGDRESPPPAPEDWHRSQVSLLASPVLESGTLPNSPAWGVEVAAGPEWAATGWRLRLLASSGFFPKRRTKSGIFDGDIDLWLLTFAGRGCLTAAPTLFEFGFCLGVELSVMTGSDSTTGEQVTDGTQYWLSPVGSVLTLWRASRNFSLFGRADVAVPSTLRSWHVGGPATPVNQVYEVDDIAVRGAVGFEVRFF
jgi:hypothetical protein